MSWTDILIAQLTNPFRIGLMVALLWTTLRLRHDTGIVLPLIAGILFFAFMLASTLPLEGADFMAQVLVGALAHAVLIAVLLVGWLLLQRFRR